MPQTTLEIILVNLGVFQPYIRQAIRNLRLFGNRSITVITDSHLTEKFQGISGIHRVSTDELDLKEFEKNHRLDESFRNGFWKNTSKRLFCLYDYMKKFGRKNCVHIENDIMIYANLNTLFPVGNKLWLVIDNKKRCIPGLLFVPHYSFLDNLVENYNYQKNDMVNMGLFFNSNRKICSSLPLIPKHSMYPKRDRFTKHFEKFNAVFDGAAIGQYLGGYDPRNRIGKKRKLLFKVLKALNIDPPPRLLHADTSGFINETCVLNYSNYQFAWKKSSGLYSPYMLVDGNWIRIINLHIHSKQLKSFCAEAPLETELIPIADE